MACPIEREMKIVLTMNKKGKQLELTNGATAMTYTFSCPVPCNRVIRVEAHDDEDAVGKIIEAGAMRCRNERSGACCDTTLFMTPLPEGRLKEVVRLMMKVYERRESAAMEQAPKPRDPGSELRRAPGDRNSRKEGGDHA